MFFSWRTAVAVVVLTLGAVQLSCDKKTSEGSRSYTIDSNFEWGTATAAFQVEGGNTHTDWYQWEASCTQSNQTVAHCESNLDGPNHWELYAQDIAAAKTMGHTALRMGLEWGKIEPTQGQYDQAVLEHYHAVMDEALAKDMTLLVTLQHFTLPIWVNNILNPEEGLGGWPGAAGDALGESPVIGAFEVFARKMAEEFGSKVDLWITINEPLVPLVGGYLAGVFPPGQSLKIETLLRDAFNMVWAHRRAYDMLHAYDQGDVDGDGKNALVSVAKHWRVFDPANAESTGSIESALRLEYLYNDVFMRAIWLGELDLNADGDISDPNEGTQSELAGGLDWLGVNFYGRFLVQDSLLRLCDDMPCSDDEGVEVPILFEENPDATHTNDLGWEIYPGGLVRVLDKVKEYGLPMRITENGIADGDDDLRPQFIVAHVQAMQEAMSKGADVRGYYHWTLVDNFEWAEGYEPRFGLLRVDYDDPDRARTKTRGADALSALIAANGANADIINEFGTFEF